MHASTCDNVLHQSQLARVFRVCVEGADTLLLLVMLYFSFFLLSFSSSFSRFFLFLFTAKSCSLSLASSTRNFNAMCTMLSALRVHYVSLTSSNITRNGEYTLQQQAIYSAVAASRALWCHSQYFFSFVGGFGAARIYQRYNVIIVSVNSSDRRQLLWVFLCRRCCLRSWSVFTTCTGTTALRHTSKRQTVSNN